MSTWNEAAERQAYEDAAFAHYLRERKKREAAGTPALLYDTQPEAAARETMFARGPGGDYIAWVYQAAWGGWKLARGGL